MRPFFFVLATLVGMVGLPLQALDAPQADPILTVTGAVTVTNGGSAARFDRAMLERLDWRDIETYTPFTEGPQSFSGPTLSSLLEVLGVEEGVLKASAVNDYMVEIPVAHAAEHGVLLAMDLDGKPMRLRNRGPIWVVYPMTEAQAEEHLFDSEMIWQLVRIDVVR